MPRDPLSHFGCLADELPELELTIKWPTSKIYGQIETRKMLQKFVGKTCSNVLRVLWTIPNTVWASMWTNHLGLATLTEHSAWSTVPWQVKLWSQLTKFQTVRNCFRISTITNLNPLRRFSCLKISRTILALGLQIFRPGLSMPRHFFVKIAIFIVCSVPLSRWRLKLSGKFAD